MKINEMLNSRFLKQTDIDGDTTVTIQAVKKDNIARDDQPEDIKPVCKFREYEKPMILNTTNTKRLFAFLGKESDDWIGKKVVLYRDEEETGSRISGGAGDSLAGEARVWLELSFVELLRRVAADRGVKPPCLA